MTQALDCPVCRSPLLALAHGDKELPICERCGGVWLDEERSRRVVAGELTDTERRLARIAGRRSRSRRTPNAYRGTAPAGEGERCCPECRTPLVPRSVDALDIVVDACHRHGSWFDRGELRVVTRWFELRAAGLDEDTARLALLLRGLGKRSRGRTEG